MLKILLIVLSYVPLLHGRKIIDRHFEISWSDTNSTQQALGTGKSSSLIDCLHLCLSKDLCSGIEYQATLHACRLFSLLKPGSSKLGAAYQRAIWARPSVETHTNSLWHTPIPVSTFPNDTAARTVVSTSIIKKSATSGIRVTYSGSFGSFGCKSCCTKFWFTFNGNNCTNPHNLDFNLYNSPASNTHWPAVKDGICGGLPAGVIAVAIETGVCFSTWARSSSNIAFLYNSNLVIEEVYYPASYPKDASLLGVTQGTPSPNFQTGSIGTTQPPLITTTYVKHLPDTDLLVLMSGNIRIDVVGTCVRWHFLFNGQECSSPSNVGELNALTLLKSNFLRGGVVGGICSNLPAGVVTVDFTVSGCPSGLGLNASSCYFGAESNENVIIEEVRRKMPTPTPGNPAFNLDFTWWAGEVTKDSGVIKTLTYDKVSLNTALRFRFFGSLSSVVASGAGGSAWCFEVDGQACADPGPACTALWSDIRIELRRPYELLSVCRGIFPGPRRVELVVKDLGGVPGDASTGWSVYANNYLVVDEVFIN